MGKQPGGFLPARANSRKETEDATVSILKPKQERPTVQHGAGERRTFMVVRERGSGGRGRGEEGRGCC